jgi:squalene-hopene/tetraprenyl-beta-curcumene cyclase
VPDADDTAGAVLALFHLKDVNPDIVASARAGMIWLMDLQNRDGGVPTFCRGWGALPFDRSSPDITAHFVRAAYAWLPHLERPFADRLRHAVAKALAYLQGAQRDDGSWVPLWFGNEHVPTNENPAYGTSRVLLALIGAPDKSAKMLHSVYLGIQWLLTTQNDDGGWGGSRSVRSSTEETALVVQSIAAAISSDALACEMELPVWRALAKGTGFLSGKVQSGDWM